MSTGSTATEGFAADTSRRTVGQLTGSYKVLWSVLLLGWLVSYADRTLTGPVISWMIQNETGFIGDAANPATLGGLVGSMFFAGYMLTQYPGGRLGDQFGHREMIVLSLVWAAILTAISGLMTGLVFFVAARVLTGLGEGVFYSNDRTLIMMHTPAPKRTLGLGVVITGLSIGLTVGILATPLLISWGEALGWGNDSWRMPFFAFAAATLGVVAWAWYYFHTRVGGALKLGPPLIRLIGFSAPAFALIVALFLAGRALEWPEWALAVGVILLALIYIAVIVRGVSKSGRGGVLLNRNVWLMYLGQIAILWNLWFFSFWTVQIVIESGTQGLLASALIATFYAGAGVLGYPLGGWLADRSLQRGGGRKPLIIGGTVIYALIIIVFGYSVTEGREPSMLLLGILLFFSSLIFNGYSVIIHGMLGDMVPDSDRGSAFGLFNLVSEIGAVASPVVSGILRDVTGSWSTGVYVAAAIALASALLFAMAKESNVHHHEDPVAA
jgi:MFS transporter, ACS family, D-galactonate transporter